MSFSEELEQLGDRLPDVRRAIHHLTARQFVSADSTKRGTVVRTLDNPKLRNFIATYFDFAGYDFKFHEQEGWYGIIPRLDEVSALKMTQMQTLVLLSLALHWQQCIDNGDVDGRANAITTFNEFWTVFEDRLRAGNGPSTNYKVLLDMLKGDFTSKGVVQVGDIDAETDNCELTIRPYVRLLAGDDILTRLSRYLDGKEKEAESLASQEEAEWNDAAAVEDN